MSHDATPKPGKEVGLDRFRRKRTKWWLWIPLFLILGLMAWYGSTIFTALRHATTINQTGGSKILTSNNHADASTDGQINILLIGIGGANHAGGNLADSIMVASIDTKAKTISLLSLPRDLYVTIPGYGKHKINEAHSDGEQNKQKGGGPALLEQTVSDALKIPIHYFVRVDFDGFRQLVDALGGVTINVKTAINDPMYPNDKTNGFEPLYISAGVHKMDGSLALKYARSRHGTSDFSRAGRQQEILMAIKDKTLTAQVLANPAKVTNIISILGNHILTDLSPSEMQQLLVIARKFDNPKIQNQVFGQGDADLVTTSEANGQSIVIPRAGMNDLTQLQIFAHAYFASAQIKAEQPTILIQNSGATKSTIASVVKELKWAGYEVEEASMPLSAETKTSLVDLTKGAKTASLDYLAKTYGFKAKKGTASDLVVPTGSPSVPLAASPDLSSTPSTYDLVLVIGKDYTPTVVQIHLSDTSNQTQTVDLKTGNLSAL